MNPRNFLNSKQKKCRCISRRKQKPSKKVRLIHLLILVRSNGSREGTEESLLLGEGVETSVEDIERGREWRVRRTKRARERARERPRERSRLRR